jgi:site-specific DNA recombinase
VQLVRVALYTRVSTEDQAKEGFSLEAQRDRLEAYCRARDWEIAESYRDDGHSGRTVRRPAYHRMMEERERWDTILVLKMDRIHRNSRNFMDMMDQLSSWDKNFVSASESLDTTTAMGRFVMDIIQRIAQLESEQIGERVYLGMAQKAKSGAGILGFTVPIGYDLREGKLVINPREAETVEVIFSLSLDGKPIREIVTNLNETRKVLTKRSKQWSYIKVHRVLHNPIYAGYIRWDGKSYLSGHEPIVPVETFNDVQKGLRDRALTGSVKSPPLILRRDNAVNVSDEPPLIPAGA